MAKEQRTVYKCDCCGTPDLPKARGLHITIMGVDPGGYPNIQVKLEDVCHDCYGELFQVSTILLDTIDRRRAAVKSKKAGAA